MIPLHHNVSELAEVQKVRKFAVNKYNPYMPDRAISLEEATRCVVMQSKWASSHNLVDARTKAPMKVEVNVLSNTDVEGLGKFITVSIKYTEQEYQIKFVVTESESHWVFLDYSAIEAAPNIELSG